MAYAPPRQWSRGDDVTAARMQVYSDGQVDINTLAGYTGGSLPTVRASELEVSLIHVWPYLHYGGNGEISDPNDAEQTISLSETGAQNVYDLRTVEWLYAGKVYFVTGVSWCAEDWEP